MPKKVKTNKVQARSNYCSYKQGTQKWLGRCIRKPPGSRSKKHEDNCGYSDKGRCIRTADRVKYIAKMRYNVSKGSSGYKKKKTKKNNKKKKPKKVTKAELKWLDDFIDGKTN
jgi:hypothetical protein